MYMVPLHSYGILYTWVQDMGSVTPCIGMSLYGKTMTFPSSAGHNVIGCDGSHKELSLLSVAFDLPTLRMPTCQTNMTIINWKCQARARVDCPTF